MEWLKCTLGGAILLLAGCSDPKPSAVDVVYVWSFCVAKCPVWLEIDDKEEDK